MTNETERAYRSVYDIIRLGESKIYATPIFDGELSAFKRHVIEEFEATSGPDDTGTALELIQKGYRTIFVPEALYFDTMPRRWRAKISIKKRRALHLVQIFAKMSKSILRKRRALPLRIALPEIYLHLVNPIIFVFCLAASLLVIVENPCLLFPLLGVMIWPRTRILAVTYMTSHFLLLDGILGYLRGQNPTIWKKVSHVAT